MRTLAPAIATGGLAIVACDAGSSGTSAASGGGGAGGQCPTGPEAMLHLSIDAEGGTVPPDTMLEVTWSAGKEPIFRLDDPSTWKTLDEGNVVCEVDATKPPPTDLATLVCHLWTSGPTRVVVSATGFAAHDETFSPKTVERCEGPVPTEVGVTLRRPEDAGAP